MAPGQRLACRSPLIRDEAVNPIGPDMFDCHAIECYRRFRLRTRIGRVDGRVQERPSLRLPPSQRRGLPGPQGSAIQRR